MVGERLQLGLTWDGYGRRLRGEGQPGAFRIGENRPDFVEKRERGNSAVARFRDAAGNFRDGGAGDGGNLRLYGRQHGRGRQRAQLGFRRNACGGNEGCVHGNACEMGRLRSAGRARASLGFVQDAFGHRNEIGEGCEKFVGHAREHIWFRQTCGNRLSRDGQRRRPFFRLTYTHDNVRPRRHRARRLRRPPRWQPSNTAKSSTRPTRDC